jgi:hypothetical protein
MSKEYWEGFIKTCLDRNVDPTPMIKAAMIVAPRPSGTPPGGMGGPKLPWMPPHPMGTEQSLMQRILGITGSKPRPTLWQRLLDVFRAPTGSLRMRGGGMGTGILGRQ